MTTTALIVEILVVGAMALIWIVGALGLCVHLPTPERAQVLVATVHDFIPLLALPLFAVTYTVGWVINFCSERVLKVFFQRKIRDRQFGDEPDEYELARVSVLQRGSADLIRDFNLDRHIIRVARGAVLNFGITATVFIGYALRGYKIAWLLAIICFAFAGLSFAQWFTRYRYHYARINRTKNILVSNPDPHDQGKGAASNL